MNATMLYPLAGLLIAGTAGLRVVHLESRSRTLFAYLLLAVFSILGFASTTTLYLSPAAAFNTLLASVVVLLFLCAVLKVDTAKPWKLELWAAYVPLVAVMGTAILLVKSWPILSIMRDVAPLSVWPFALSAISSLLLLILGWKVSFAYFIAPLIAILGKRRHWRSRAYFGLLDTAYSYSGLAILDIREEALSCYISAGEHQKAASIALGLGHLETALDQYSQHGDYVGQADVLGQLGQWDRAAELYIQGSAPLRAAAAYGQAELYAQAATLYQEANQENEFVAMCEQGSLFDTLGSFYKKNRRYADAAHAYAKGGHLAEAAQCHHDARNYQKAGKIYLELDDCTKAREEYQKANALPAFIKLLKTNNKTDALVQMKTALMADFSRLRGLQAQEDSLAVQRTHAQMLNQLDLLTLTNPIDAILARNITWGAITFFESQQNQADLERAHGATLTLNALMKQGLQLAPMEILALSVRLLLFSAIKGKHDELRQHLHVFLKELHDGDLEKVSSKEKEFLRSMIQNTVRVLSARGQTRLISELQRSFTILQ